MSLSEVVARLSSVNGRRRTRTASIRDIAESALAVHRGADFDMGHGGHVANSYKYPASATAWLVFRASDGTIRVTITEANAKKGSTGFGGIVRGDRLLSNTPIGHTMTLGEIAEVLTGQAWESHTPDGVIEDYLEESLVA